MIPFSCFCVLDILFHDCETVKVQMKRINEIFSDYETGGNINTAIVESVVLSRKTKTVEMKIRSDKYIEIRELGHFNKFIIKSILSLEKR